MRRYRGPNFYLKEVKISDSKYRWKKEEFCNDKMYNTSLLTSCDLSKDEIKSFLIGQIFYYPNINRTVHKISIHLENKKIHEMNLYKRKNKVSVIKSIVDGLDDEIESIEISMVNQKTKDKEIMKITREEKTNNVRLGSNKLN